MGTLLSTPLNIVVQLALYGDLPSADEWGGIVCILGGFALLLIDEFGGCRRTAAAPPTASVAAVACSTAAAPAAGCEAMDSPGAPGAGALRYGG